MPYWDHKGETQGIASPLCDSYNKRKMPGLSLRWTGLFSFMWPPRLSEKSRRELKSLYPTTGATTDSQSSEGVLLLLRQSPPLQVSARVFSMYSGCISGVCLQWCIQGASQVFVCMGVFRAHLRCLPAMVYSGCISGVCQQWCIQGASQVFASNGVFRVHLRCLPAMVYSGRISGVCLQWCIQGASQVFVCKGVFGAHLRCLSAKVYSVRISGVCNWRERSSAL